MTVHEFKDKFIKILLQIYYNLVNYNTSVDLRIAYKTVKVSIARVGRAWER